MPAPQLNKPVSPYRWYSLTYQSNGVVNDAMHNQAKRAIAEILIHGFEIVDIHSYIHGNIFFAVNTNAPVRKFNEIITALRAPLVARAPSLLFSLVLVAKTFETNINYLYVYGSDTMDQHFKDSIIDIFP